MTTRKTRTRKHVIADMSLHHLAYIIVSCTFTLEPTRADYGYDLSIFTFDAAGQYENGNMLVQLKATDRLRRDSQTGDIMFRISKRDVLTWESEPYPAYLVVFDARQGKAYAIYLQRYFAASGLSAAIMTGRSVEVHLPPAEVDMATVRQWRADKNAILARIGTMRHD